MNISLKYAVVERERRFLVAAVPDGVVATRQIFDRYLDGGRLRLREVVDTDGSTTRKIGQKIRLDNGPAEVACTNIYLNDAEWCALSTLPGRTLHKVRHIVERDSLRVAIDEFADGTLLAEIDDGDRAPGLVPEWLEVVEDVSTDEAWAGACLARRQPPQHLSG